MVLVAYLFDDWGVNQASDAACDMHERVSGCRGQHG